jgi:hypothetical protein
MRNDGHAAGLPLLALVLLLAAGLADPARAQNQDETGLYQAVVPLRGAADSDRVAAFGEALRVVVVRVSGERNAGSRGAIAAAAAKPGRYVQQYSATASRSLKVGFEPRAIDQLVLEAGLPIWPAERPATLVVLFDPTVASGGRALLSSDRSAAREQVERAAELRGVRVLWPATEIAVGAATDPARLRALGAVAGTSSHTGVLVGVPHGSAFEWRYSAPDDADVSRQGAAADGAHLLADTLSERFAPSSTRDIGRQSIVISGIGDLGSYAAVLGYLESLSLVRRVDVDEASGDSLHLGVTMRGDRALLRRVVRLGRVLDVPASSAGDGSDFVFAQ